MKIKTILSITAIIFASVACTDFLEVDQPKTQITSSRVFTNDASAVSAISGIYSSMMNSGSFASGSGGSMSILSGLSSDDYVDLANSTTSRQYYRNSLEPSNPAIDNMWANLYLYIFYANSILEGLQSSAGMTEPVRKQIEGEARFVRAFSYFYLTNLFGDVPLVLSTDFRVTSTMERTPSGSVFERIIADLIAARDLMVLDYAHVTAGRIRPNSFTASALLARVHLFKENWSEAETEASRVIGNTALYGIVTDLNSVFLRTSREAIWQLMPTSPQFNTFEATIFRNLSTVALSMQTANVFETGDLRRANWLITRTNAANVTYLSPNKYKVGVTGQPLTEFSMVIRLAELYLVRAEARARLNNISGSATDLNIVRQRAGLPGTTATTGPTMLLAIEQERRVELFSEWGHRWLDLKRTGRADAVLGQVKAEWQTTDTLYPVPKAERDTNANLTQNPGY